MAKNSPENLLLELQKAVADLYDSNTNYLSRVESLKKSWELILKTSDSSLEKHKDLKINTLLVNSVRTMLFAEWVTVPDSEHQTIRGYIEKAHKLINVSVPSQICLYKYILKNFKNFWDDIELLNVLNGKFFELNLNDIQLLTSEGIVMIYLRLCKLCDARCDDMAFILCAKTLMALRSVSNDHSLKQLTPSHNYILSIFDIYLCFLQKLGHDAKLIDEIKSLSNDEALQLIKRNLNYSIGLNRLIKYHSRVVKIAANTYIGKFMMLIINENNKDFYCDLVKEWLLIHKDTPINIFRDIAKKIFLTASSGKNIYLACNLMQKMDIAEWKLLLLELYIKGIISDLNELELLKIEKSCNENNLIKFETDLSYRYLELADMLKYSNYFVQECLLTAFSLNPIEKTYHLIVDMAPNISFENIETNQNTILSEISNNQANNALKSEIKAETSALDISKNLENLTEQKTNHIDVLNSIIGTDKMIKSFYYDAFKASSSIIDSKELINLPQNIRIDLTIILNSPRLKFLSWLLPWCELNENCKKLLNKDNRLELARKSLITANDNLEYLHLDFNQFKNIPDTDVRDIENGYEIFLNEKESDHNLINTYKRKKQISHNKILSKTKNEMKFKIQKKVRDTKSVKVGKINLKGSSLNNENYIKRISNFESNKNITKSRIISKRNLSSKLNSKQQTKNLFAKIGNLIDVQSNEDIANKKVQFTQPLCNNSSNTINIANRKISTLKRIHGKENNDLDIPLIKKRAFTKNNNLPLYTNDNKLIKNRLTDSNNNNSLTRYNLIKSDQIKIQQETKDYEIMKTLNQNNCTSSLVKTTFLNEFYKYNYETELILSGDKEIEQYMKEIHSKHDDNNSININEIDEKIIDEILDMEEDYNKTNITTLNKEIFANSDFEIITKDIAYLTQDSTDDMNKGNI